MNANKIAACDVIRYDARENLFAAAERSVAVEADFELRLNGKPFGRFFCTPADLEDLAVGILAQAGKISAADEIVRLEVTGSQIAVETKPVAAQIIDDIQPAQIEPSDANSADVNLTDVQFRAKDILACADKILGELSTTHAITNGAHSGALFDGTRLLLFREDVGRHNVFDKIFGAALREGIFLGDKILIFSGRCSSEMVVKLARMKIPAVAAKSVPTTHAVNLAAKFGITLAGRMRADSFCIYTGFKRIVL